MGRPSKLIEPRRDTSVDVDAVPATLDVVALALPPAARSFTRADGVNVVIAGLAHLAIIGAFVAPDRRFGGGGVDLEAIGVEIVTVAPALEARSGARGRGAAAADVQVSEQDGGAQSVAEEAATRDSRRDEKPAADAMPPPADIEVKNWQEPPRPADAPAVEPVIAPTRGDGTVPEAVAQPRPVEAEQPRSSLDSASALEVMQRFRGGAAARGREDTPQTAFVMAAARAGMRDAYKEAIVLAIRANPPRNATGHAGQVKLEFLVRPDGTIGDVRVASSSRSELLDEVAMAAMRSLRLPPPPSTLTADLLVYDMVFTFQ